MNVTNRYEYSEAIWRYAPPVIIVIGTVGHILTIILVSYGKRKTTSFSVYLMALAVVDLIILYTLALSNWLLYAFGISVKDSSRTMCKINYFVSFSMTHLSSWLVMCLTGERVYCIYLSKNSSQIPGPRVGLSVIGAVVLFLFVLNAHNLYGRDLLETSNGLFCGFIDNDYRAFFYTYWNKIHFVVYFGLPVTVIILGNSAIVIKLFRSARSMVGRTSTLSDKRALQVLLITVLISVTYTILVSPISLLFFIAPVRVLELSATICFHLDFINHAINFWLYVMSGSRFRSDLRRVLLRCIHTGHSTQTEISAISSGGIQRPSDNFNDLHAEHGEHTEIN